MSDNDLIRRGDVLSAFETEFNGKGEECYWFGGCREEVVEVVKTVPAVPHEMSAREYEKAFQRITYEDVETYRVWWEAIHDEDWGRAVAIVEKWAREHPEERSEE